MLQFSLTPSSVQPWVWWCEATQTVLCLVIHLHHHHQHRDSLLPCAVYMYVVMVTFIPLTNCLSKPFWVDLIQRGAKEGGGEIYQGPQKILSTLQRSLFIVGLMAVCFLFPAHFFPTSFSARLASHWLRGRTTWSPPTTVMGREKPSSSTTGSPGLSPRQAIHTR